MQEPNDIINFWFAESNRKNHFQRSDAFDQLIRDNFGQTYELASSGTLTDWQQSAIGTLALIIVLDQFPRNMFRQSPRSFATDKQARDLTIYAIEQGFALQLATHERVFLYMPLMHSESLDDQELSVKLYSELGLKDNLDYAIRHRDIIARFQRFPHRNKILGRDSSADETEFLTHPGSSF